MKVLKSNFCLNILFFIAAILHFVFVWHKYSYIRSSLELDIIFFTAKLISLILIILLWQFIPITINAFKYNKTKIKELYIFFILYLLLNFIVLILIWPGYTHGEYIFAYDSVKTSHNIATFWQWMFGYYTYVMYNVFPFIWGSFIATTIIESLIFSYCICEIKNKLSNKYYWISIIPFCIPPVLIMNLCPVRLIFTTWLAILLFTFMFFNRAKYNSLTSSKITAIIFAVISSIFVCFRTEYIALLLLLPILVFVLKVFTKKAFLIYLLVFWSSFCLINSIQKYFINYEYELHNLSFLYERVITANPNIKNRAEYEVLIRKVFTEWDEKGHDSEIDFSNEANIKNVMRNFTKIIIYNANYLTRENIDKYIHNEPQIIDIETYTPSLYSENIKHIDKEIKPLNTKLRNKIIFLFVNGNDKINLRQHIYNPIINVCIVVFLAIAGLFYKEYFYTYFLIIWSSILTLLLITLPWTNYMYLWAFYLNSYVFLSIFIISILEKYTSKKSLL